MVVWMVMRRREVVTIKREVVVVVTMEVVLVRMMMMMTMGMVMTRREVREAITVLPAVARPTESITVADRFQRKVIF